MKASIITIGDEILIGQIVDTNAAWMAAQLSEAGILLASKMTAGDDKKSILTALDRAFHDADLILMTGGLGPTKDDMTKTALLEYFGGGMVFSQQTYDRIEKLFVKRNIPISEAHRQQCYLPDAAEIIVNEMGTAPGMWFEKDGKSLCSMPGVPHEMKYVMMHGVLPRVAAISDVVYRQKTIHTSGIGESQLADVIEPILESHPVSIAYLPSHGAVRLRLSKVGKAGEEAQVEDTLESAVAPVVEAISQYIYGYDGETLESSVGKLLLQKGLMLGTAESCTGGYIAHLITSVAGASRYFRGSIVAYNNDVKESILGVELKTLEECGAVSEETVREMVAGALPVLGCDIAIAVSGISGPGGGSPAKPVGTVWVAVGSKEQVMVKKYLFVKDRILNIKYTAVYALDLLRKFLTAR
ncbi:MAG: competence/damage-inducible protein A [Saprospiraceae bacterium]|nr:competence/damage-inducible protein A [Saprospiraceae bacterium]